MNATDAITSQATFPLSRTDPLKPPPEYARFRDEAPLKKVTLWNGRTAWLATRMEDVKAILASPHVSVNPFTPGYPFLTPRREATVKAYKTFLVMDPPDHTKFRRMLSGDFTQKRMELLRPGIEAMVEKLIDDMLTKGPPVDLVEMLAQRLPVNVVSELLGVSHDDDEQLVKWSLEQLGLTGDPSVAIDANKKMLAYFDDLIKQMETGPVDGNKNTLSRFVENIKAGTIERIDAVLLAWQFYFAGADTTANMISLGVLSFILAPEQQEKLFAKPELLNNAIEEMLRFHAIAHYNAARVATADIKVGDQVIAKGDGIYALVNAANRDPSVFPQPDKFDIERKNAEEHVTFSYGLHQCLGQPLARVELRAVFGRLFQRIPGLKLAVPLEELKFKEHMHVYGLYSLPVTW
ncbi:MAG: cytochrome P450 [Casimicrobiaceae bacterium]